MAMPHTLLLHEPNPSRSLASWLLAGKLLARKPLARAPLAGLSLATRLCRGRVWATIQVLLQVLLLASLLACLCAGTDVLAHTKSAADAQAQATADTGGSGETGSGSIIPVEENSIMSDPTTWLLQSIRRASSREILAAVNAGANITEEVVWLAAIHTDGPTLAFFLQRLGLSPLATYTIGVKPREKQDPSNVGLAMRRHLISLMTSGRHQTNNLNEVTLLHLAALVGNTDTARYLLEEGADPNAKTDYGMTPILVAYNSWIRTWNPMHVSTKAIATLSRNTNYPGFIYALLDAGASSQPLDDLLEERRDTLERYVVGLAENFDVPMKGGGFMRLGKLLESICTNTAWGLVDLKLFPKDSPHYCRMVVVFLGKLKSDGSSLAVPFAFLDDRFVVPGDLSLADKLSIWHEGSAFSRLENLEFLDSLGVDLSNDEFWDRMDARFK